MVRINLVDPKELTDQHLIAEHNEILMLCGCFQKSLGSKNGIRDIPQDFTLGKGHIKFFYDKGHYLFLRFTRIQAEMKRRGFKSRKRFPTHLWFAQYFGSWTPTVQDIDTVRERIRTKIAMKPKWYKYEGKDIGASFYIDE